MALYSYTLQRCRVCVGTILLGIVLWIIICRGELMYKSMYVYSYIYVCVYELPHIPVQGWYPQFVASLLRS